MSDVGCEVVRLESGALAMRDAATGEIMHPSVGPRIESEALYVAASRLRERLQEGGPEPLVVLDVGLGAGSNAAAALRAADALSASARRLEMISFDHTLAPLQLALGCGHAEAFGFDAPSAEAGQALLQTHLHDSARTQWRLRLGDLSEALAVEPSASADVVFWDPYSPISSPALWSVGMFRTLRRVCREGASVHTYSAATTTRTALLLAGFYVGLGPPSGKRQRPTTVAATSLGVLEAPLTPAWLAQLADARVPFSSDAPADALAQLMAHPQFARVSR